MISALRKLQNNQSDDLPAELAAFGISGSKARGFKALFLSHPPLEMRIAALERVL
jgi:heat shock protein HtpX